MHSEIARQRHYNPLMFVVNGACSKIVCGASSGDDMKLSIVATALFACLSLGVSVNAQPTPGEVFTNCPLCPDMMEVPGGTFLRGDFLGVGEDDEQPRDEVTITEFEVAINEVTFVQYQECVDDGACESIASDGGWGRESRPVINVSFLEALIYVSWLSRETGKQYRLLSDAEWEYAARGNMAKPYVSSSRTDGGGDQWDWCYGNILVDQASRQLTGRTSGASCNDQYPHTAPVGMFWANNYGLKDMSGNVWEWTMDCYQGHYRGVPRDGSPLLTGDCSFHVVRGGSWSSNSMSARIANRSRREPGAGDNDIGFRVARTLPVATTPPVDCTPP